MVVAICRGPAAQRWIPHGMPHQYMRELLD
jgi:hypothetical protein